MGQCKCGGETSYLTHKVKTLKKAREWDESVAEVPVWIHQERCRGCGRQETSVKRDVDLGGVL